jgi:crossover junction endodeoxyribonuclease RuvC
MLFKSHKDQPKTIIGIDPGTRVTGYGIIRLRKNKYEAVDYGCICPPPTAKLSERYLIIFNALESILERYQPQALAVEAQYVGKNPQSVLKLGQARGVAMVAAKRKGIAIYEYSPSSIKKAVGSGKASKAQVQELVKMLLGLQVLPEPNDAADALAVALCHSNAVRYCSSIDREI